MAASLSLSATLTRSCFVFSLTWPGSSLRKCFISTAAPAWAARTAASTSWSNMGASRQQIREDETIPLHHFTTPDGDGRVEHGAVPGEGVEFAPLAAGIHRGRQARQQRGVEVAAREGGIERLRIHAGERGPEAARDHLPRQRRRVAAPEREGGTEP